MSSRSIVHWECESPEHRSLRSRHGTGGLTIHEGAWAYCDGADSDDGHRWSATGGVALESLVRWTAPNGNGDHAAIAKTTRQDVAIAKKKTSGAGRA